MPSAAFLIALATVLTQPGEPTPEGQPAVEQQTVIVVVGAAGNKELGKQFLSWAERWRAAAKRGEANWLQVGRDEQEDKGSDRERLKQLIKEADGASSEPLWLVLIGHGTFDGRRAKFNLRGPDLSANELSTWLKPLKRPVAVINCASASGPFVNRVSAQGRVIVTATKSGYEYNFARFGDYLSSAITDLGADLDKDGQTSLLEAFLTACSRVAEFYKEEGRLATEHGLIDDNGDQLGTTADWYRGVRATRSAKDGAEVDGLRAGQFHLVRSEREKSMPVEVRRRRDQLEREIAKLRSQKKRLAVDAYFEQLEPLAIELARLYDDIEAKTE